MRNLAVVITTINPPSDGISAIGANFIDDPKAVIVIGDRKSPSGWSCPGTTFLSYDDQQYLNFRTARALPANTYARKMLGYLIAASEGCTWIRETDDDNIPYPAFYDQPPAEITGRFPSQVEEWINIYTEFGCNFSWPRGFPLDEIVRSWQSSDVSTRRERVTPLILQSLADGDPDVDAIFRLTTPNREPIKFKDQEPLVIPSGAWTPFNSQVTTWHHSLLPAMYLPSTCSFRMTDIWRSFIAQRLIATLEGSLVILPSTVRQERNSHDLMQDFRDELEGYVGYKRFVNVLNSVTLYGGLGYLGDNLHAIYQTLVNEGFFQNSELDALDAWLGDVSSTQEMVP